MPTITRYDETIGLWVEADIVYPFGDPAHGYQEVSTRYLPADYVPPPPGPIVITEANLTPEGFRYIEEGKDAAGTVLMSRPLNYAPPSPSGKYLIEGHEFYFDQTTNEFRAADLVAGLTEEQAFAELVTRYPYFPDRLRSRPDVFVGADGQLRARDLLNNQRNIDLISKYQLGFPAGWNPLDPTQYAQLTAGRSEFDQFMEDYTVPVFQNTFKAINLALAVSGVSGLFGGPTLVGALPGADPSAVAGSVGTGAETIVTDAGTFTYGTGVESPLLLPGGDTLLSGGEGGTLLGGAGNDQLARESLQLPETLVNPSEIEAFATAPGAPALDSTILLSQSPYLGATPAAVAGLDVPTTGIHHYILEGPDRFASPEYRLPGLPTSLLGSSEASTFSQLKTILGVGATTAGIVERAISLFSGAPARPTVATRAPVAPAPYRYSGPYSSTLGQDTLMGGAGSDLLADDAGTGLSWGTILLVGAGLAVLIMASQKEGQ